MSWRPAFWAVAAGVVAVDQATKQWVLSTLEPGVNHPLLGDLLSLQLVFNSGAAFSLGNAFTWVLTVVALVVSVAIIVYGRRAQGTAVAAIFGAALGGAVGNLIDRLFRESSFGEGHVVDFINYGDLFVGNVADIAIVGAAIVLVIMSMFSVQILAPAASPAEPSADVEETGPASAPADGDADAEPVAGEDPGEARA